MRPSRGRRGPRASEPVRSVRGAVDADDVRDRAPRRSTKGRGCSDVSCRSLRRPGPQRGHRSSGTTVLKKPSIIASSSASDIPGSAGKSPSRSTFVRSPSGVYVWTNVAPSNGPPLILVSIPLGGSSRCSIVVSKVDPSGLKTSALTVDHAVGDADEPMALERDVRVASGAHVLEELVRGRVERRDSLLLVVHAHRFFLLFVRGAVPRRRDQRQLGRLELFDVLEDAAPSARGTRPSSSSL